MTKVDPRLATKSHQHVWRRLGWLPWHPGSPESALSADGQPLIRAWECPCGLVSHDPGEEDGCKACTRFMATAQAHL